MSEDMNQRDRDAKIAALLFIRTSLQQLIQPILSSPTAKGLDSANDNLLACSLAA